MTVATARRVIHPAYSYRHEIPCATITNVFQVREQDESQIGQTPISSPVALRLTKAPPAGAYVYCTLNGIQQLPTDFIVDAEHLILASWPLLYRGDRIWVQFALAKE